MAKLVIVESPAKARTIAKYLGQGFQVMPSMGHVRDLPTNEMGVDIEGGFEPAYRVIKGREKAVAALRKAAGSAEEIYLATDLDREGEAIAWHLVQAIKAPVEKVRRVTFSEITAPAVRRAFSRPGAIDENKVNAQQARRILDRIVGYKLSPLLWRKVAKGLSAGRVQSVAAMLVVHREREIAAFKPEEYWEIEVELRPLPGAPDAGQSFTAKLEQLEGAEVKLPNEPECRALLAELEAARYAVAELSAKTKRGSPGPPFITSRLQQAAASQLRFSARETMRLAQQLYEGVELGAEGSVGLITYMRTDSVAVSTEAIGQCRTFIEQTFGPPYLPDKPRHYRQSARAQAAHEAIRPTDVARLPEQVKPFLSDRQQRLYELIWRQFVASQMAPSVRHVTQVRVAAGRATFAAEGSRLLFDGHERVAGSSQSDKLVPALVKGQELEKVKLEPAQRFTQPPARYSEGSLIRALERLGIGRPSTYAPILSTIQERGYVEQRQRKLYATALGGLVTDELIKHFPHLVNVKFTSHMEDDLDEVEGGRQEWRAVLAEFYGPFKEELEKAMSQMERVPGRKTDQMCDKCGKPMVIRSGSRGLFLGCSGYPECKNSKPLEPQGEGEQPEVKENCPTCGKPLRMVRGSRGPFIGCTGYPECRYTKPVGRAAQPAQASDVVCELCGKPMVVRSGRRGQFLGCTGYPECRNTKPLERRPQGEEAGES